MFLLSGTIGMITTKAVSFAWFVMYITNLKSQFKDIEQLKLKITTIFANWYTIKSKCVICDCIHLQISLFGLQ